MLKKMDVWWAEHGNPWRCKNVEKFRREQPRAIVVEMKDAHHYLFRGPTQAEVARLTREFLQGGGAINR